jgi:predicted acylesterase/phospholipase RssA
MGHVQAEPQPADAQGLRQEIRLAVVMTGGVSLAVWMGGVARELNLLLHQGNPPSEQSQRVRQQYQALLDLTDVSVSLDVLSGTSAGGVNSAVLALANVNHADIGGLRELWMEHGSFGTLLRKPGDSPTPSLLQGDAQLLTGLSDGLTRILRTSASHDDNGDLKRPPTDVFITTTLLDGQPSRFVDDYDTLVSDVDHHGLFHFDTERLIGQQAANQLALAARCSASFPVAFEPGHLTIGPGAAIDMSNLSNATQSCYVADGGLLANRPIAAAVRAVFDRPACSDVRRLLLFVVPTTLGNPVIIGDTLPPLGSALMKDLAAAMSQSITADLVGIRAHNESVQERIDSYWQLAGIGQRAKDALVSKEIYRQYRERFASDLTRSLLDEALRQQDPATIPLSDSAPANDASAERHVGDVADQIGNALAQTVAGFLPAAAPAVGDYQALSQLGRRGYDSAKVIVLSLIRRAYAAKPALDQRQGLAVARRAVHEALPPPPAASLDLTGMVSTVLSPGITAQNLGGRLAGEWEKRQQTPEDLGEGWRRLAVAVAVAKPLLESLLNTSASDDAILSYLESDSDVIAHQLAQLHVAHTALLPSPSAADQRLDLIEVSADTGTLLDPRKDAASKLTGFQLHHFGAFYKNSWRANDWMWGRLDGAGWLVHILLDPERLRTLARLDDNPDNFPARLIARLSAIASSASGAEPGGVTDVPIPGPVQQELDDLFGTVRPPMTAMPETAKWVAAGIQQVILDEELPFIRDQIYKDQKAGANVNSAAGKFMAIIDNPSASQETRLAACRISDETFAGEADSRLFQKTLKQTLLVAVAAAADADKVPAPLKVALRGARAELRLVPAGLMAHSLTLAQRLKDRRRPWAGAAAGRSGPRPSD